MHPRNNVFLRHSEQSTHICAVFAWRAGHTNAQKMDQKYTSWRDGFPLPKSMKPQLIRAIADALLGCKNVCCKHPIGNKTMGKILQHLFLDAILQCQNNFAWLIESAARKRQSVAFSILINMACAPMGTHNEIRWWIQFHRLRQSMSCGQRHPCTHKWQSALAFHCVSTKFSHWINKTRTRLATRVV